MARNIDTDLDHPHERVIINEADLRAALAKKLLETGMPVTPPRTTS